VPLKLKIPRGKAKVIEVKKLTYEQALGMRVLKERPVGVPRSLWRNLTVRGMLPCKSCGKWVRAKHMVDGSCRPCKRQEAEKIKTAMRSVLEGKSHAVQ